MAADVRAELPAELVLDGTRYPAIWLRDNCACAGCAAAGSGQKLFGITDVPADSRIENVEEDADGVLVVFAPDGHQSRYERAWLEANRPGRALPADDRAEDAKRLWRAADLAEAVPTGEWQAFAGDPAERARCRLRRTLTTRIATRYPGSSSCTAWRMPPKAATPGSWTPSASRRPCAVSVLPPSTG